MTFSHISQIEQLKQAIQAKRNRCIAICERVDAIRSVIPWMGEKDLQTAGQELFELRKELMAHEQYIVRAEAKINEFYRNPIREAA